ncbi:2'-5' RNA ligase family protein [Mesorhizobium sp. CAU 1732]|uniref:2'-5' RNA ligase family protein n=1 Tax=Mesorhizobium sp. CAU 1732 TaxID=3140358 RepID=UPI003261151D
MQFAFDFNDVSKRVIAGQAGRKTRIVPRRKSISQPCLPGLERRGVDSFFLVLGPDEEAAECIRRSVHAELVVRRHLQIWPKKGHLPHISLLGLGAYDGIPRDRVAGVAKIAEGFSHPGFDVSFDTLMRFRRSNAVVLTGGDDGCIRRFRLSLHEALRAGGLRVPGGSSFTPHMTLLYSTSPFEDCRVSAVQWRADKFFLIHSMVGDSKHVVLGRWPLRG